MKAYKSIVFLFLAIFFASPVAHSAGNMPAATPDWDGTVIWNGAYWKWTSDCDISLDYNMPFTDMRSSVNSPWNDDPVSSEWVGYYDMDIYADIKTNWNNDADFSNWTDYEYSTYYTGIAGNRDRIRFVNDHIEIEDISPAALSETAEAISLNLADLTGWSKSQLAGKKVFVVLRGFDWSGTSDAGTDNAMVYVHLTYDGGSGVIVSYDELDDGEVSIEVGGRFISSSLDSGLNNLVVFYTIGIYDPNYVYATSMSSSSFSYSKSGNDYSAYPTKTVTAPFDLPDSFTGGDDLANDNRLVFSGLSSWGFDAAQKDFKSVKARNEVDAWTRSSTNKKSGTVKLEAAGYAKSYACGLDAATTSKPTSLDSIVVICKDESTCKGTFEYLDTRDGDGLETLEDQDIYMTRLKKSY